jgi:hypothetical protein
MSSSEGAPSDFEMSESNEDFNHKVNTPVYVPGKVQIICVTIHA